MKIMIKKGIKIIKIMKKKKGRKSRKDYQTQEKKLILVIFQSKLLIGLRKLIMKNVKIKEKIKEK